MRGRPLGWSPPLGLVHEGKWIGQGNERRWRCERCGCEWQWRPSPDRRCPGIAKYWDGRFPPGLATISQLRRKGLEPRDAVRLSRVRRKEGRS